MTPSQTLALILDNLRKAAAAHAGRHWAFAPVVLILWPYLHRVAARFAALSLRVRHFGAAKPAAPRTHAPAEPAEEAPVRKPRKPQLPRHFGWLAFLGPEFRAYASQLRHLICGAEVRALIESSPQAGRILRPLCRMLGIEPAPDLPPSLYPPRPPRPRRERPRRAKPPPFAYEPAGAAPRPRVDRADWWRPKRA